MKIPIWLASIFVTAFLAEQAWMVTQIIGLREDIVGINVTLAVRQVMPPANSVTIDGRQR